MLYEKRLKQWRPTGAGRPASPRSQGRILQLRLDQFNRTLIMQKYELQARAWAERHRRLAGSPKHSVAIDSTVISLRFRRHWPHLSQLVNCRRLVRTDLRNPRNELRWGPYPRAQDARDFPPRSVIRLVTQSISKFFAEQ